MGGAGADAVMVVLVVTVTVPPPPQSLLTDGTDNDEDAHGLDWGDLDGIG